MQSFRSERTKPGKLLANLGIKCDTGSTNLQLSRRFKLSNPMLLEYRVSLAKQCDVKQTHTKRKD